MPKAVYIPPPIPKESIPREGVEATITNARIVRDQWTSIGTLKLGLGLSVKIKGDDNEYSALFNLDKETLTGSVGRILVSAGIVDVDSNLEAKLDKLKGKKFRIFNRGGKLYWYPA